MQLEHFCHTRKKETLEPKISPQLTLKESEECDHLNELSILKPKTGTDREANTKRQTHNLLHSNLAQQYG